jgi:hypothetical protein
MSVRGTSRLDEDVTTRQQLGRIHLEFFKVNIVEGPQGRR